MTEKLIFILLFLLILAVIPISGENRENNVDITKEESLLQETKHVLYISSYSPALFTFEQQLEGIKKRFGNNKKIKLDAEFMDTKNFNTVQNLQNFYNSLKYKIDNGKKYDAVIVGDDNGLVYLMKRKDTLFPEVPIFFMGINNIDLAAECQKDPLVTGVVEAKSFNKTVALAKDLNPNIKRVVGLIDNTASSMAVLQDFSKLEDQFPDLEFITIDLSTMTFDRFFQELEKIQKDDIVFHMAAITDITGRMMDFKDINDRMDEILNVPVYGAVNFGIGEGIFGGCVISHVDQGFAAADMVMEFFMGKPMSDFEFSTESPNAYILDYQKFKEFKFSFEKLPEDLVWVNRTYTFWEKYSHLILISVSIFITQLLIIILLIINTQRRKKSESEKETLIRELYHRTKNNMNVISSMLILEKNYKSHESIEDIIDNTVQRIQIMSMVHEKLYKSKNLSKINLKEYFSDLINGIAISYKTLWDGVKINSKFEDIYVLLDIAVPLGIVVNEIITNIYKYAFPETKSGYINIILKKLPGNKIELVIKDSGIGLNDDFDSKKSGSLGFTIIHDIITHQLQGTLKVTSNMGLEYHIIVVSDLYKERV